MAEVIKLRPDAKDGVQEALARAMEEAKAIEATEMALVLIGPDEKVGYCSTPTAALHFEVCAIRRHLEDEMMEGE